MRVCQPASMLVYLPFYIAIEKMEYEISTFDSPKECLQALSKNNAEISVGDPLLQPYFDYEKNEICLFGGFIRKLPASLITFDPFIKEASSKELNSKTIISYTEPSTSFFVAKNLKEQYQLGPVLETPFNTELTPLITLEADVAVVFEPNVTYAIQNGARELLDFSSEIDTVTGFCTTRKVLRENKNELKEFLVLVQEGIQVFQNDEEKTLQIAKKYFPLVDELVLTAALENIRNAKIYCEDLRFTKRELEKGCKLRNVNVESKYKKEYLSNFSL